MLFTISKRSTGYYWLRGMLIKIDSLGNEEWISTPGISDSLTGGLENTIEFNNYFYSIGAYWSPGDTIFPVFYKINASGEEVYHKVYRDINVFGNIYDNYFLRIEQDSNNFIVGNTHNYEYAGEGNWGTLRIDTLGHILGYQETPGSISPFSMAKTTIINSWFAQECMSPAQQAKPIFCL